MGWFEDWEAKRMRQWERKKRNIKRLMPFVERVQTEIAPRLARLTPTLRNAINHGVYKAAEHYAESPRFRYYRLRFNGLVRRTALIHMLRLHGLGPKRERDWAEAEGRKPPGCYSLPER